MPKQLGHRNSNLQSPATDTDRRGLSSHHPIIPSWPENQKTRRAQTKVLRRLNLISCFSVAIFGPHKLSFLCLKALASWPNEGEFISGEVI